MYTSCITEKATEKQRRFQTALLEALRHQAYEEITVTSLCAAAGLSRKTFYRLFGCKDDVLSALIDTAILECRNGAGPEASVTESLEVLFRYWKDQAPLLDALDRNHMSAMLTERSVLQFFEEGADATRYLAWDDPASRQEQTVFFLSGVLGVIIYWHHTGYRRSVEEMAAIAARVLTNPVLATPEK